MSSYRAPGTDPRWWRAITTLLRVLVRQGADPHSLILTTRPVRDDGSRDDDWSEDITEKPGEPDFLILPGPTGPPPPHRPTGRGRQTSRSER